MSNSDSEEENHIRYGTPLEAYDEDEVPGKRKPGHVVSEQYAYDEQGRRRFHGAFTGGFTAGHGNTVASLEGWSPATFRSTRTEKAQQNVQKPEDFMDEEDRDQFGIAPREINTTKEFTSSKRKHKKNELTDGPIPGVPVLQTLLQLAHETVAVKILKSMGWKPGQGIGERMTAKEKRLQNKSNKKVYGCNMPEQFHPQPSSEDGDGDLNGSANESSEEEYSDVLFAPDDFELYVQRPKNDVFGLGYEGMSRRSVLGSISGKYGDVSGVGPSSHLVMQDKGKRVSIRGQAFGVGALEEEDEDIYAREDMSNYDYLLGSESKKEEKSKLAKKTGHVLDGFLAAIVPTMGIKKYPPPVLPKDYKPGIGGARKSRFEPIDTRNDSARAQTRDRGLGRHDLTALERGSILGETYSSLAEPTVPENTADKSRSKKLTPEEIIAAVTGRNINFVGDSDKSAPKTDQNEGHNNDPDVFRPFASNPEKQARYEDFLKVKDGGDIGKVAAGKDKLMQWELERENKEFEQASRLYRPLTGTMGDRFVRPTDAEGASIDPLASTPKLSDRYGVTQEQADAASKKMYGKLTRTEKQWRPESLLCKRFNVPDPFGQRPSEMSGATKKKTQYSIFEFLETPVHSKDSFLRDQAAFTGAKNKTAQHKTAEIIKTANTVVADKAEHECTKDNEVIVTTKHKRMTVTDLFLMEKEKERETKVQNHSETVTKECIANVEEKETPGVEDAIEKFNKIDLYKAIFLSDSESDDEAGQTEAAAAPKPTGIGEVVNPMNVERNKSPPRGIFANLDFDHLNSWRARAAAGDNDKEGAKNEPEVKISTESVDLLEAYGPKLPEKVVRQPTSVETPTFISKVNSKASSDVAVVELSSSSDSWVDTEELRRMKGEASKPKHKKGKKSHKEKRKKHKYKSKSKKHKS